MKKFKRLLIIICLLAFQMTTFSQIYFAKDSKIKINEAYTIMADEKKKALEMAISQIEKNCGKGSSATLKTRLSVQYGPPCNKRGGT